MDPSRAATETFAPATAEELARFVAENARTERRRLFPVGGRTALHFGYPRSRSDVTVATGQLAQIIDYPARDMTVTVEAGMRVEHLQKILGEESQRLPIDIPQAHRATIGGAIATNTSGPGRFAHGTFRDYLIGVTAVDGQGRLMSAGGRVVKNVAGYDLCKLLVGSLGTLAIITQVTLKLRPAVEHRQCLWLAFPAESDGSGIEIIDAALERLLTSATRPCAQEVMTPQAAHQIQRESKLDLTEDAYVLCLCYEGGPEETQWQLETVERELKDTGPADSIRLDATERGTLWTALAEYQAASDDPLTFQAAIPPSKVVDFVQLAAHERLPLQCHAGNGVIIGHLPDRCSRVDEAIAVLDPLRQSCEHSGGSLAILACDDSWKPELAPLSSGSPAVQLSARIKSALDPQSLFGTHTAG